MSCTCDQLDPAEYPDDWLCDFCENRRRYFEEECEEAGVWGSDEYEDHIDLSPLTARQAEVVDYMLGAGVPCSQEEVGRWFGHKTREYDRAIAALEHHEVIRAVDTGFDVVLRKNVTRYETTGFFPKQGIRAPRKKKRET